MNNRILITGAGGFLGRSLVASLVQKGYSLSALDNNWRGTLDSIPTHEYLEKHIVDVLSFDHVKKCLMNIDVVFHLAAINGTENFYSIPDRVLEVGIIGTHNLIKASIENKVRHFVFMSSSEVYHFPSLIPTPEEIEFKIPEVQNPRFSYAGSKIAGELMTIHYLRKAGIRHTIIRPHNVYGPNMGLEHVIPQLTRRLFDAFWSEGHCEKVQMKIQGSGAETRSFIYISDAIRAIEKCTFSQSTEKRKEDIYNIGTNEEIQIIKLAQLIGECRGFEVDVVASPLIPGSSPRRCPDVTRLESLGFRPTVSLNTGLRETVNWYWEFFKRDREKNLKC